MREQLTLPLGHRAALSADDFIVSESSREAVAWIDRWPDWPAPGLVIAGPPASGKTHLAEVWRQRSGARAIAAAALVREAVAELAAARAVVVEDADRGGDERALLHLYNLLREGAGHLLLTGRSPPARWPLGLPDLRSRLAALPIAVLAPPDDTVLEAVMVKLFADRQLLVEPEVVRFLANRLDRSFAAVADAVAALDRAALAHGRAVTVPLVRAVLPNTVK